MRYLQSFFEIANSSDVSSVYKAIHKDMQHIHLQEPIYCINWSISVWAFGEKDSFTAIRAGMNGGKQGRYCVPQHQLNTNMIRMILM